MDSDQAGLSGRMTCRGQCEPLRLIPEDGLPSPYIVRSAGWKYEPPPDMIFHTAGSDLSALFLKAWLSITELQASTSPPTPQLDEPLLQLD